MLTPEAVPPSTSLSASEKTIHTQNKSHSLDLSVTNGPTILEETSIESSLGASSHFHPTISRALTSIHEYSQESLEEIALHLSEKELHIAQAVNAIGGRAREFILQASDRAQTPEEAYKLLIAQRDEQLSNQRYSHDFHLEDFRTPQEALQYANEKLFEALSQGAQGNEEVVDIRALDLAVMVTEAALLRDSLGKRQEESPDFQKHQQIMKEALRGPNGVSPQIEEAFKQVLEKKLQELGYVPSLTIVHDKDGNLVDGENSPLKPGAVVGQLVDNLDLIEKIPSYQRIVLGDNLDRIPGHAALAKEMFEYAGASTHKMFSDAEKLFKETEQNPSIKHIVLTANMRDYAQGFVGYEGIEVRGKTADSCTSEMKPESLFDLVLKDPTKVYIMSDNADESLTRAVREGFKTGTTPLNIEDTVFFASRVAGPFDTKDHLLAQALREAGIPFAKNQVQEGPEGTREGYQGVTSLVSLYEKWQAEKLEQGWPTSPLHATVQQKLHTLFLDSPKALQELSARWGAEKDQLLSELQKQIPTGEVDPRLLAQTANIAERNAQLHTHIGGVTKFLDKALEQYQKETQDFSSDDPQRAIIATRLLREALKEASDSVIQASHKNIRPTSGIQHIGGVKISSVDAEDRHLKEVIAHIDTVLAEKLRSHSSEVDSLDIISLRGREIRSSGAQEYTLLVPLTPKGLTKAEGIKGVTQLEDGMFLLAEGSGKTHAEQERALQRGLRGDITIAELYYRNPFAQGGGLEKTIREQAKVFKDAGFKVRLVGGNDPDPKSYDEALLSSFEHKTIPLLHERNKEILNIAASLYKGTVSPEFDRLYREVKAELKEALTGVDFVVVHNPLFLRNPLLQKALLDLHKEGELGNTKIVGWVHDIGIYTEPEKFPKEFSDDSPWGYVSRIQKDIDYVPVSPAVSKRLHTVPRTEEATDGSYRFGMVVPPGSDYDAMLPSGRVVEELRKVINWDQIDSLWVTPGRMAERKNTLGAIQGVAFNPGAYLVITAKPKVERLPDGTERVNDPYYEEVKATVEQLGVQDRVIFLHSLVGEITDKEYEKTLGELAILADGGLTVPFEEGFGIDPRNIALVSGTIVASDDEALQGNLGDAAHYVTRQGHPLEVAAAMRAELKQNPHIGLRQKARTTESWANRLSGTVQYFDEMSAQLSDKPIEQ